MATLLKIQTYTTEDFKRLKSAGLVAALENCDEIAVCFVGKPVLRIVKGCNPDAKGSITVNDLMRFSKNEINHLLGRKKALHLLATKHKLPIAFVQRY